jgi:exosome complex RNA-binding protein Rrp42 (RNase PH superfamily)
MNVTFPPVPPTYDSGYFNRAFATFSQAVNQSIKKIESVDSILLQAPNGSVWKVTVDNSGNLTTDSVALGQTGSPPY